MLRLRLRLLLRLWRLRSLGLRGGGLQLAHAGVFVFVLRRALLLLLGRVGGVWWHFPAEGRTWRTAAATTARSRRGHAGRGGEIDVRRRGRDIRLCFQQAGLQVQDVLAQLVVFVLQGAEVVLHGLEVFDLLFELLDVAFFALAEGALHTERISMLLSRSTRGYGCGYGYRTCAARFCAARLLVDSSLLPFEPDGLSPSSPALSPPPPPLIWAYGACCCCATFGSRWWSCGLADSDAWYGFSRPGAPAVGGGG